MKKISLIVVSTILLASVISLNSCKKEEEKATKGLITGVTFTDWVDQDSNGDDWDSELQGYDPDIYFIIEDQDGNVLYDLGSNNRKENVGDVESFGWDFSSVEINLDTEFYIRLYDYDDLSSNDNMGSCGGIKLRDYVNKEPSTIPVSCDNMEYTLSVSWAK